MTALKPLDPSSSIPAYFGAELRRLRMAAKLTQDELGAKILYTSSLVGLIESARRTPTRDFTERCDTELSGGGHLVRLWELLTTARWPDAAKQATRLLHTATTLRCFETTAIPRPLQTPDYARAVLAARNEHASADDLDHAVGTVLERRRVLDTATCWFVLDEAVLHRHVGGPDTMGAQLQHLLDAAAPSRIVIQVVPFDAHEHPGMPGPFTLISPDQAPDVAYIDGYTAILIDNPDVTARCAHTFDILRATALSPRRSLDLINSAIVRCGGTLARADANECAQLAVSRPGEGR